MVIQNIKCDICGLDDYETIFTVDSLDGNLVRCKQCSLIYINPRCEDFTIDSFNAIEERKEIYIRLLKRLEKLSLINAEVRAKEMIVKKKVALNRLRDILKVKSSGKLLDIGCAEGIFLSIAKRCYNVCGVDPHPVYSEIARSKELKVIKGTIFDASFPAGYFDIVTMLYVIEHFSSPREYLKEVCRILKKDGIIMIETPNIKSLWCYMFRRKWSRLTPAHYFFFDYQTISTLLELTGFRVFRLMAAEKYITFRLIVDKLRQVNRKILHEGFLRTGKLFGMDNVVFKSPIGDSMLVLGCKK
jgi:2-polyprenyl-3-methyl-5-hydroxy-6-metoxy-1,4-benzoquinol methylase